MGILEANALKQAEMIEKNLKKNTSGERETTRKQTT